MPKLKPVSLSFIMTKSSLNPIFSSTQSCGHVNNFNLEDVGIFNVVGGLSLENSYLYIQHNDVI